MDLSLQTNHSILVPTTQLTIQTSSGSDDEDDDDEHENEDDDEECQINNIDSGSLQDIEKIKSQSYWNRRI